MNTIKSASANHGIYNDLTELIGNTPIVSLGGFCKHYGINCEIAAKLEYFNPLGSAKDRVGLAMIEDAEKKGKLQKDSVIIEPTSGNTGIGLAFTAAIKGYRMILTMPENMSKERIQLLSALGAEIILTPKEEGMAGSIKKAEELSEKFPSSFIPGQFSNPANPAVHKLTTGPEILKATDGRLDYFVAGVGTGGTLTGVGEVLKDYDSNIKICAVEPYNSPVLSKGEKGVHGLMGIGAGFIPDILNREIIDKVITVKEEDAYEMARTVAKTDGILIGISSGAALYAAKEIALSENEKNKRIIVLFPDSGERYLSADLFI